MTRQAEKVPHGPVKCISDGERVEGRVWLLLLLLLVEQLEESFLSELQESSCQLSLSLSLSVAYTPPPLSFQFLFNTSFSCSQFISVPYHWSWFTVFFLLSNDTEVHFPRKTTGNFNAHHHKSKKNKKKHFNGHKIQAVLELAAFFFFPQIGHQALSLLLLYQSHLPIAILQICAPSNLNWSCDWNVKLLNTEAST